MLAELNCDLSWVLYAYNPDLFGDRKWCLVWTYSLFPPFFFLLDLDYLVSRRFLDSRQARASVFSGRKLGSWLRNFILWSACLGMQAHCATSNKFCDGFVWSCHLLGFGYNTRPNAKRLAAYRSQEWWPCKGPIWQSSPAVALPRIPLYNLYEFLLLGRFCVIVDCIFIINTFLTNFLPVAFRERKMPCLYSQPFFLSCLYWISPWDSPPC